MRMLMQVTMPHAPFNAAVKDGSVNKTMQKIMEDTKPEAAWFTEFEGQRCGIFIVDIKDPSQIPALAEPWFLRFQADVNFRIVMSPEELGRSGLDSIGKKWS